MKIPIDHSAGQQRAEQFERLVEILILRMYKEQNVTRHFILPRSKNKKSYGPSSVDFLIRAPKGEITVIETKAPYTDSASYGVNRAFRRLKRFYQRFPDRNDVRKIVLAISVELPRQSDEEAEAPAAFSERQGVSWEIWDSRKIRALLKQHCNVAIASFTVDSLARAVSHLASPMHVLAERRPITFPGLDLFAAAKHPIGEQRNVVVVCADYCSYSRFVSASSSDGKLMKSIMGRFYRETRRIIALNRGLLDKFLGDGALCYWLEPVSSAQIDNCVRELIGLSLNLAEEWQEQIDLNVKPKGMRVGGAIGTVTFIPESERSPSPIHAIGECINLAARLQVAALPNTLLISNRLRTAIFRADKTFEEIKPTELKNIGEVLVWKKDYGGSGV